MKISKVLQIINQSVRIDSVSTVINRNLGDVCFEIISYNENIKIVANNKPKPQRNNNTV